MRLVLKLIMLLLPGYLSAQNDTVMYYSITGDPVNSKEEAFVYEELSKVSPGQFEMTRFQNFNGRWKEDFKTQIYADSDTSFVLINLRNKFKPDTLVRYYHHYDSNFLVSEYKDAVLVARGPGKCALPLIKSGKWLYFGKSNGKPEKEEVYVNNRMITNKVWINDTVFVNDVFQIAEKMPEYKGGQNEYIKFISAHLVYPKFAVENGIQGTVFVQMIITDSGIVKGAKIIRGVEESLNDEALRVVSLMPGNWIPAKNGNKNVSVFMNLPIYFKLK